MVGMGTGAHQHRRRDTSLARVAAGPPHVLASHDRGSRSPLERHRIRDALVGGGRGPGPRRPPLAPVLPQLDRVVLATPAEASFARRAGSRPIGRSIMLSRFAATPQQIVDGIALSTDFPVR